VALPLVAPLARLDDPTLARLRARLLEIDLTPKKIEPIVGRTSAVHPLLRRPLLAYHLRNESGAFAIAARALMFGDPVGRPDLEAALGEVTPALLEAGLLVETEAGVVSPFSLVAIGPFYVLTDELSQGGDAVMGLGPATVSLCSAAAPLRGVGRSLDLGCGAGTVALVLSASSERVVATDVNPRALELARFNLRLNAVSNVEVREGSVFEPVAGEKFDLIAAQPPFVPDASGGKGGTFMSGGPRGDEISLALLRGVHDMLTKDGRAIVMAEWGHGPTMATPADRIRQALGAAEIDALVFQFEPSSVDAHAAEYGAALHPGLGPAFEAEVVRRRAHLAELGFDMMAPTLVALANAAGRKPSFDVIQAGPLGRAAPNARRIDRLVRARRLVSSMDSLLSTRLRMVSGVVLREEQVGPGADVTSTLAAILPPAAMSDPLRLNPIVLRLASAVHESRNARNGIDSYKRNYSSEDTVEHLAALVANALLTGLLEISD
jgi:precorrin-6B methylase 2